MLLTRDQIRQDKSFDALTEAILERDQPRTAGLFHEMVARDGRSLGDALGTVTAAEAPFVQVPSHINVRDGQITLINNDHTILGLRTAAHLAPFLPETYRLLPFLQSVWYIPAGLDIWNQLLGNYPGRYATMKGMEVPPPSYGPAVWNDEQDADHRGGHRRGAPARAPDRDGERRRAAVLRALPRPRRRRSACGRGSATSCSSSASSTCRTRSPAGKPAIPATRRSAPAPSPTSPTTSAGIGPTASTTWACRTWRSARSTTRSTTPPA